MGIKVRSPPFWALLLLVSINSDVLTGNSTMCHAASLNVGEETTNTTGVGESSGVQPEVTLAPTIVSNETAIVVNATTEAPVTTTTTSEVFTSSSVAPVVVSSEAPVVPVVATASPSPGVKPNKTHNHHDDDDDDDLDDEDDDDDDDDDHHKKKKGKKTIVVEGHPITVTELVVDEKLLAPRAVGMAEEGQTLTTVKPCHTHGGAHSKRNVSEVEVHGGNGTRNGTVFPEGKDDLGTGTAIEKIKDGIAGVVSTLKNSVTSIFMPGTGLDLSAHNGTNCNHTRVNSTEAPVNGTLVAPVALDNSTLPLANMTVPVNETVALNGTMRSEALNETSAPPMPSNETMTNATLTLLPVGANDTVLLNVTTTPSPVSVNTTDNSTTTTSAPTLESTQEPGSSTVAPVVVRERRSPKKNYDEERIGGAGGFWDMLEEWDEKIFGKKDKDKKKKKKEKLAYLGLI